MVGFAAPAALVETRGNAVRCRRAGRWTGSRRSGGKAARVSMTAAVSADGDEKGARDAVLYPQTAEPVSELDPDMNGKYKSWKIRIFYSIFMGYASFYLTRNSFTYTAPGMRAALGFSLEQLGLITSVFPLCYGFSKLIAGVLADRFSTRVFFAMGLALTGMINIIFGFQTSLAVMIPLWALNGVFQGFGAPPCAKLLTTWYPKKERGTWWGFWNTSHNTGGFVIPLLAGYCVRAFGWQYGMIVPGFIAIGMSLFLLDRVRDSPATVGLPPADPDEVVEDIGSNTGGKKKGASWETLKTHVFANPYIWLLAVSYFFVYFVRQGVSSWAHIFLLDYKMVGNAQEAAFRVSGMEIGGLLGSLSSGYTSDRIMRGRRIPVIVTWMMGVMVSLVAFYYVPAAWRYANWLSVFCIGFFIYGPQMLVGLAGAEIVDKSAVSSAIGLLGWIAYLGASIAGFPLTKIVTNYGWGAYVASLLGFSSIAILLLLPMWRLGAVMDKKPKPIEVPDTEREVPLMPVGADDYFEDCGFCAATGTIIKLECGPATPNQGMSCKYIEIPCPECGGTGHIRVRRPALAVPAEGRDE